MTNTNVVDHNRSKMKDCVYKLIFLFRKAMAGKYIYMYLFLLLNTSTLALINGNENCSQHESELLCNYIPLNIPAGVRIVNINLWPAGPNGERHLKHGTFLSENWSSIEVLTISDNLDIYTVLHGNCFQGLDRLKELHMHIRKINTISEDTFVGLEKIYILDLNDCARLDTKSLLAALNNTEVMPEVKIITMSRVNNVWKGVDLDIHFFETLGMKKELELIDVSDSYISVIDFCALKELGKSVKLLNISFSNIAYSLLPGKNGYICTPTLEILDISYIIGYLNKDSPKRVKILDTVKALRKSQLKVLKLLSNLTTLNISGWAPDVSLWLDNVTFIIPEHIPMKLESLIVCDNTITRLNAFYRYPQSPHEPTLKYLDLSKNKMEFIAPELISPLPKLEMIDLSSNRLTIMTKENESLFETLFFGLKKLKIINLSDNQLGFVPRSMFVYNLKLEVLQLSNNRLTYFNCDISELAGLRRLDLSRNLIRALGQSSISKLNSLPKTINNLDNTTVTAIINLAQNPISCSKCDDVLFIEWILATPHIHNKDHLLLCMDVNKKEKAITEETKQDLKMICRRPTLIAVGTTVSIVVVLIFSTFVIIIIRKSKKDKQACHFEEILQRLRDGDGYYEFVTFLSFSSEDDDFVYEYVFNNLNENLRLMAGIERDLVCVGDRHFRLGQFVPNEILRCLERVSIVTVVVSYNFCASDYCFSELEQAYSLRKPIVLILKERVEVDNMQPLLKFLFLEKTRIMFERNEDGGYELKNTWENVCKSLLELVR